MYLPYRNFVNPPQLLRQRTNRQRCWCDILKVVAHNTQLNTHLIKENATNSIRTLSFERESINSTPFHHNKKHSIKLINVLIHNNATLEKAIFN